MPIDVSGSVFADALGINNRGQIVGNYFDATGKHGFLATIPEPSSLLLHASGFAVLAGWRWKQPIGTSCKLYGLVPNFVNIRFNFSLEVAKLRQNYRVQLSLTGSSL
ncbi:MAG TPA: hypothetical protein VKP13_15165 [Nitrospira sp.]|nr:hypothetical protein [Nitrospira sp.]